MLLGRMLEEKAERYSQKPAIISGDYRLSYLELHKHSNRLANGLIGLGLDKGDRTVLLLSSRTEFVVSYFGIVKAGGIAVPLNTQLQAEDLGFYFQDCQPKVLISESPLLEQLIPFLPTWGFKGQIVDLSSQPNGQFYDYRKVLTNNSSQPPRIKQEPEDIATILYTSGTTGHPKGVLTSHQAQFLAANAMAQGFDQRDADVIVNIFPLFHSGFVNCTLLTTLSQGGTIVMASSTIPEELLKTIEEEAATVLGGVPPLYTGLANLPEAEVKSRNLDSLRLWWCGGALLPAEIRNRFKQKFGLDIIELWAATETISYITIQPLAGSGKDGSVGEALPRLELKVVNDQGEELPPNQVGEIIVTAPSLMKGYFNNPHATAEAIKNGWYYTGDMGSIDEDGYVFISGRKKEMIKVGAQDVYPSDIEEILYTHPKVVEAAVVGIPDKVLGEVVKAVISLKGGETATEEEIIEFCKEKLTSHEIPKKVEFVTTLPRTPAGKIRREELKR